MLNDDNCGPEKSLKPRCQPDLFDLSIKCTTNDTDDYRQYVSHFFGRNKSHTATIPHHYFPVLCRKHYQERRYRWSEDPGAYAAFQCDSILKILGKMAQKDFVDESGSKWPWWCGFQLRLLSLVDTGTSSASMPPWLLKMCPKAMQDLDGSTKTPTGLHCSLSQLIQIVKALKIWCTNTDSMLPRVEALPVTIGMIDKQALEIAERNCKKIQIQRNVLRNDCNRLEEFCHAKFTSSRPVGRARHAFEISLQKVENAEQNVVSASIDLQASATTLPAMRERKIRSDHPLGSSLHEKILSLEAQSTKRRRATGLTNGRGKRIRSDQTET